MEESTKLTEKRTRKRIFCIVTVMALIASFIALSIASVANDVYALIKPNGKVTLILDVPVSLNEMGHILEEYGVINNPHIFIIYARARSSDEADPSFLGTVTLDRSMSYREILFELSKAK